MNDKPVKHMYHLIIAILAASTCITSIFFQFKMASFDFESWCKTTQLKEATVETLKKEDLDSEEALKLLTPKDVEGLGLSVGQKRVLESAVRNLRQETKVQTEQRDNKDPVTTKSLAKDGGLEEILKKIEGAGSLEDSLLAIGSSDFLPGKTYASSAKLVHYPTIGQQPTRVSWPKTKGGSH